MKTGLVRLAFRHLPLSNIHPLARKAAEAADCARRQNKFWEFHDAMFADPQHLSTADLETLAGRFGLDQFSFNACLTSEGASQVQKDVAEADMLRITGTPTIIIGPFQKNGTLQPKAMLNGLKTMGELEEIVMKLAERQVQ